MEWIKKYKEFNSPRKRVNFFRKHVVHVKGEMLFSGGLEPNVLLEIESSFKLGNFVACVLLSQLTVEHCLAHCFLMTEHESVCIKGFAKLIDTAVDTKLIDEMLAIRLHELRLMRNPYVHPRFGAGKGTQISRVIEKGFDCNELPVADGIEAIKILGEFINSHS